MNFVKRARRTAEEAREQILDAAERRLVDGGPAGIRLQEVAADVGVSHPALLHHFGSREGLIDAVVERATQRLQEDLMRALSAGDAPPDPAALLDRVFETLFTRGHARLVAWLVLSGYDPFRGKALRSGWSAIADVTHQLRGSRQATPEDTQFTILLSALALFGQAIAGKATFKMAGLGADAEPRFRAWLGELLRDHLDR